MGEAEIEQLLADRSLVREALTDELVVSIWAKAAASYADAAVAGLTSEAAFQLLYTAAFQATVATQAAHGLRPKSTANHYKAFYALRKLDPAAEPAGTMFDEMRGTRNESVYESTHDEVELAAMLVEARGNLPGMMAALRMSIIAVRPDIVARLPRIS